VTHLDDLLLRRIRLGLLLPDGARDLLPAVGRICRAELGWDDARWEREANEYLRTWRVCYSVPAGELTPTLPGR
jgi:glycerol-3-phosphate dehydrogenase